MSHIYNPPWRAFNADGNLGKEYGPKSAAAYARQVAKFKDWSYQAQKQSIADAELIAAFVCCARPELDESEREVFRYCFEQGLGTRTAAEDMGVTRYAVRCYLERLRAKAKAWQKGRPGESLHVEQNAPAIDTGGEKGQE